MAVSTTRRTWIRRLVTWGLTIVLLAWVFQKVPLAQTWTALRAAGPAAVVGLTLVYFAYSFAADVVATWATFGWFCAPLRLLDVFGIRGATYLLAVVNYNLGQGGIVYVVGKQSGVGIARATGTVLLTMGVMFVSLLMLAALGSWTGNPSEHRLWLMRWISTGGLAAFAAYLLIIAVQPALLARREVFRPLFEAGVTGHAKAWVVRFPHVAGHVVFQWALLQVFGVRVPFSDAATLLPVTFVITWIPITVQGLGTSQVATIELFSRYATGTTLEERNAQVLGFSLALSATFLVYSLVAGLACLRTPIARSALLAGREPQASSDRMRGGDA